MSSPERLLPVAGVELCVQTFGPRDAAPVLLVAGGASSMLYWPEEFCARLAAGPRWVVRYDHRDTGRSTTCPPGRPDYTAADLRGDVVGVLDALGIARAHLVGLSMGGGLAQAVAVEHPDRVRTLTLLATSPVDPTADSDLPSMSEQTRAEFAAVAEPDWDDRTAVIDYLVELERLCAARSRPFDTGGMQAVMERVVARTPEVRSMFNHFTTVGDGGGPDRSAGIAAPTLVLHGEEDPVLPLPHGVALAAAIPGAELITLPGVGHELPRRAWEVVVPAILRHTTS